MRAQGVVVLTIALGGFACGKPSAGTSATPSASAPGSASAPAVANSASTSAMATATSSGTAAASASGAPGSTATAGAWKGTYKSAAATLTVPPIWQKVPWQDTKSTAGLGEGTMSLTVDASGRVSGLLEGPLGPAVIEGASSDGKIAASIRRKDPKDRGFTGTLLAAAAGDKVEGTMNVSLGEAAALRTATFTLSPDTAAGH
jgi:hypothetical protein